MTQDSVFEMLRAHPFTRGMTELQLVSLATFAELAWFEQDQPIFGVGERSRYFYLLVSGTVFLELQTPVYTVCIEQLKGGEAFGWSALVDEPHRAFRVRALEKCSTICLPGDRLLSACEADDRLGSLVFHQVAEMVGRRLRAAEARFAEFCGKRIEDRMSSRRLSTAARPADTPGSKTGRPSV